MSDNHDLLNDNDMCSFSGHEAEEMCFNCGDHTCGVRDITPKEGYLKILEFRHFERHIVFSQSDRISKKKAISNGVNVQVVVRV